jgi:DNA-binding MarR family transcriptional regulator
MEREKLESLVLNMVNFHQIFEKEFTRLIPVISNDEISPLLSKMLNEIHLQGKTTASHLSKVLNQSVPNTSRSVNTLYKLGYIEKKQDEKDKRIVYLTLSIKGFHLMKQFLVMYQEKFMTRFDVFTEEEIDELNQSFDSIKNLFIKMRNLNED